MTTTTYTITNGEGATYGNTDTTTLNHRQGGRRADRARSDDSVMPPIVHIHNRLRREQHMPEKFDNDLGRTVAADRAVRRMKARFAIRLALTVPAVMLASPPTAVLALSTVCTGTSQVFNANGTAPNGTVQSFPVPAGVTQVTIDAAGAAGGRNSLALGGGGAELAASFAVTPLETLNIVVGGAGGSGTTGGGGGGNDGVGGGGGSYHAAPTIFAQSGVQSGDGQVSLCYIVFAGTPGKANCHGKTVSALAQQYGGLNNAAAAGDYDSVADLQKAITTYCGD
jgi:hypothetical protein